MLSGGIWTSTTATSGRLASARRKKVVRPPGLRHDLQAGALQDPGDPLAQQDIVLAEYHAQRHRSIVLLLRAR